MREESWAVSLAFLMQSLRSSVRKQVGFVQAEYVHVGRANSSFRMSHSDFGVKFFWDLSVPCAFL
jgi:hypothetical protein